MEFIQANAVMISGLILLIAYIFIALEKIPKVTVALIGAGLTLLLGLVSQSKDIAGTLNPHYFANFVDFNNIDDLIFKARGKHIQKVQYGKLPMEFDYMILNLFTDLNRTTEHCMNISWMIRKKEENKASNNLVYTW